MQHPMYRPDEIIRLAQAYGEHYGWTLSRVSREVFGRQNFQTFPRMAAGKGCRSVNLEIASEFFDTGWPPGVPWPLDTPRHSSEAAE